MLTNAFFKTRTDGKELSNSSMIGRSSETEFTVSLWGFASGLTQSYGQGIYTLNGSFYNNNDPGGIFRIFIFPGGGVKVQTGAGGVGGELILSDVGSPIQMNKWFHLMLVLDNNTLNIFVDGQDKTSLATVTGTISTMPSLLSGAYANYMLGYFNNATYSWQGSVVHIAQWDSNKSSDISTIYNNGQPGDLTSLSPKNWWKLTDGSLVDSGSEANNAVAISTLPTVVATNVNSSSSGGISSGMTEQNLVNNNVSTLNGESSGMNNTNLVQSNLTRKQPFSSYSIDLDNPGGDYMEVPDPASSILAYGEDKFTFSGWIKPNTFIEQAGLIARYKNSTSRVTLKLSYQNGFDGLMFQIVDTPSISNFHITWNDILTQSEWQHVCLVYDGGNNSCKIYINGVDKGAGTILGSVPSSLPNFNGEPIDIGVDAMNGVNNRLFDGEISNFATFSEVLNEDDAVNLYNSGISQDLRNFRISPTAWWPMDESYTYFNGSVLVARDVINSNDANGLNIVQENIVGNAPGSESNGIGVNLSLADLKGDMKNSTTNSYSINMADYADTADSGRSTNVP